MFSACETYEKQLRIEKTRLSHQVWSHGGSTLKKKKDIKRPFFPPCRNWPTCVVGSNPKKLIWAHVGKTQWADVPDKSKFLRNQMYCQFTYCTRDETRRAELYIVNKTSTSFSVSLDRDDGLLPSSSPSLPTCQFFRRLLSKSAGVVVNGHQRFRILNDSYQKIFYVMKYGAQCSSGL